VKEPVSHADTVSNFSLTCWVVGTAVGRGGWPLCYPSPSPCNLLLRGQASEPSSFMHHSICVPLPSIGISLVTSARYRRRSLSNDIVAMCGWRSISRYRLIDIIPTDHLKDFCINSCSNLSYLLLSLPDLTFSTDTRLTLHNVKTWQCYCHWNWKLDWPKMVHSFLSKEWQNIWAWLSIRFTY